MYFHCRHVRTLQSQSEEDESVVSSLLNEKQLFLVKALKNYILCLRTGVSVTGVSVTGVSVTGVSACYTIKLPFLITFRCI